MKKKILTYLITLAVLAFFIWLFLTGFIDESNLRANIVWGYIIAAGIGCWLILLSNES